MEAILDRIAAWAPRRQVFTLFGNDVYIGTFSSFEFALACARKLSFQEMHITASYMDEVFSHETLWNCFS
jgi:hypothetical protein